MARHGDGIYQRGKTWWLDFTQRGERHVARLGKNISRTVAGELARVERAGVLKGEAGIGKTARKDIVFDKAAEQFSEWAKTNKRPKIRGAMPRASRASRTRSPACAWATSIR